MARRGRPKWKLPEIAKPVTLIIKFVSTPPVLIAPIVLDNVPVVSGSAEIELPKDDDLQEVSRKAWEGFSEKRSSLMGEKLSFIPLILKEGHKVCIIDLEDVNHESDLWIGSVICTVLGSKPPIQVFEGFICRIWAVFGVDKVLRLDNGYFMVRFTDESA